MARLWPGTSERGRDSAADRVREGEDNGDAKGITGFQSTERDGWVVSTDTRWTKVGITMTVISLVKYLMFVFNGLVFIGGICLLCVGIWVITDPKGVQNVISSPYLSAGAFLVIFVGVALSFLGFLGCYGAISRNREMLLLFFLLVLLVFTVEIIAATLIHIHGQKIQDDFFRIQLKQNYQGDNSSDVFSRTWNTFMIMFACCGISGPDDFQECSSFREKQPDDLWPHACCTHTNFQKRTQLLDLKHCKQRDPNFINNQGCFSTIARILKKYVSITEACCLGVIAIEVFAMFFSCCLYRYFD